MIKQSSITTTSRREFINVAHMLASAVDVKNNHGLVIDVVGNRNIKKSLAIDAFIHALMHNYGTFRVPESNRMMFEKYPGQANQGMVIGTVTDNKHSIIIGFTRNLWGQSYFVLHGGINRPSILFIPKKNVNSLAASEASPDMRVSLENIEGDEFHHFWKIELMSDRLIDHDKMQDIMKRFNGIKSRREAKSPQVFSR